MRIDSVAVKVCKRCRMTKLRRISQFIAEGGRSNDSNGGWLQECWVYPNKDAFTPYALSNSLKAYRGRDTHY